jgi:acyl carrier protein
MTLDTATAVRQFVLDEFLSGDGVDDLDDDFDLVTTGVIDSLGLLELLSWMQEEFHILLSDAVLGPNELRSVRAISSFIDGIRASNPLARS